MAQVRKSNVVRSLTLLVPWYKPGLPFWSPLSDLRFVTAFRDTPSGSTFRRSSRRTGIREDNDGSRQGYLRVVRGLPLGCLRFCVGHGPNESVGAAGRGVTEGYLAQAH